MARRPPSTSPNKILVIFLVVFILTSIGLFVWNYTLLKDRDKWDTRAADKDKQLRASENTKEWHGYQRDELMAAVGIKQFTDKSEGVKQWKENRDLFLKGSKYGDQEGYKEFQDVVKEVLEKKLDGFDDGYKSKFVELQDRLKAELDPLRQKYSAKWKDYDSKAQDYALLEKKYAADREAQLKAIQEGSAKAVKARAEASQSMTLALQKNSEMQKTAADKEEEFNKTIANKELEIRKWQEQAKIAEEMAKNPNRSLGEPHALLLDISRGKPLWDVPRGKVIRVEEAGKKVFIDKGSADGVKPGLTFNVFAAAPNGRAAEVLKATIEVVRVQDAAMSVCKVNTFYDIEGKEISVSEAGAARLFRENGGPLAEGDLLFNIFWGAHAAIAGIIDANGAEARGPLGEAEDLKQFISQLQRMGVVIDAYIDLRDGKLVGDIGFKTNFLIRGLRAPTPQEGGEDPRVKAINDNIVGLRNKAVDAGVFMLSAENFAVITGFRMPGSANAQQTLKFIPRPPAGPSLQTGGGQQAGDLPKKGQ